MSERVGFIGLGIMGLGMARNLLKARFGLTVWNRTASKAEGLVGEGAKLATSPADLAAGCDVIIICVSDTPDVEAVLLGEDGVLQGVQAGALVVDCSTISPIKTQQFAEALAGKGAYMLDAPISGGSEGAALGTLSIMVGGDAEQVERAMPFLQAMGKSITHVGPNGSGQMVKLVNQILVAHSMLALGEAFLRMAGEIYLPGLLLQYALEFALAGGCWFLSYGRVRLPDPR